MKQLARKLRAYVTLYSIFAAWLLINFLMIFDYYYERKNPPSGFIPSNYEPPNMTVLLIFFAIMLCELLFAYGILCPWLEKGRGIRTALLLVLNFSWALLSALASGTRPASPLIWHFIWLSLLEVILIIIFISELLAGFKSTQRSCND